MAFSQTAIVDPHFVVHGAELLITWGTTAPAGTRYQLYVDRKLTWNGTKTSALIPLPSAKAEIDIGTIASTDNPITDFSSSLPSPAYNDRALLQWVGGSYESETLAGFHVYAAPAPTASVDYSSPAGTVAAYPQGQVLDGFGVGGFGDGGFGEAASNYSWESDPLQPGGLWRFGVRPFDASGTEGTTSEVTVEIVAPPNPPAANASGARLTLTYNPTSHVATLAWNASPP